MVDPMLSFDYVATIWIPCIYYACLRKLNSPWNRRQYKYNRNGYKVENQKCVYWNILGLYNNWQIIHCIDSL